MRRLRWAGAALIVLAVSAPAAAQERAVEVEFGGGYHAGIQVGDIIEFPSVPTVDIRVTRWGSARWGISGRALAGFGAFDPGEYGVSERRDPAYFQVMARYRSSVSGRTTFHAGIGGGVGRYGETGWIVSGGRRTRWFPHFLALEALASQEITERFSVRAGVSMVVPIHLHPVVLASYKF